MPGLDYNLLKEDVHEDDDAALYHPYESDEDIEYDTDEVNDSMLANQFSENGGRNQPDNIAGSVEFSTSPAYVSPTVSLRSAQYYAEENLILREVNSEMVTASPGFVINPILQEPLTRNNEYYSSLGNYLVHELRNMTPDQAEIAERLIDHIIHEAGLGRLTASTELRLT